LHVAEGTDQGRLDVSVVRVFPVVLAVLGGRRSHEKGGEGLIERVVSEDVVVDGPELLRNYSNANLISLQGSVFFRADCGVAGRERWPPLDG